MLQEHEKDVMSEDNLHDNMINRRDLPGYRLKKAAVTAALDIRLARMRRSPERCARNLMELGLSAFPDKLTKDEQMILLQKFMIVCKNRDIIKARELFFASFLS
jgi:hypothetical protein